eukprot:s662_g14.t2
MVAESLERQCETMCRPLDFPNCTLETAIEAETQIRTVKLMPKRDIEITPQNTGAKRLDSEDDFTPAKPNKRPCRTAEYKSSWKTHKEWANGEEGSESDHESAASVLSEGIERIVWSDDEEAEPVKSRPESCDGANNLLQLVPVARPASNLELTALSALRNLVPRSLQEADLGLGDLGLAYGRRRGSSNGKASFQAVENSTPLLALPPPTPLTKLPKLSELMEVGRASYRAAQAAKLAAPQAHHHRSCYG